MFDCDEQTILKVYHECGHAVVAKLFENSFCIQLITLEEDKIPDSELILGTEGMLHIKIKKQVLDNLSFDNIKELVITLYAGFATQNIYTISRTEIEKNISMYSVNFNDLNKNKCSGDFGYADDWIKQLSSYQSISSYEYKAAIVYFLLMYLTQPEVWYGVEHLVRGLLEQHKKTLTFDQINSNMEQSGLNDYLKNNSSRLVSIIF